MTEPLQKPGRSKQDYATPRAFLTAVYERLGIDAFEFDFAASMANTVALLYWGEADNSLAKTRPNWLRATNGGWGWLNPPFSDIAPWAERCAQLRADGGCVALLVPAAVGANWYREHVHGHACVLALNGRLSFDGKNPYPKDCLLALYAPHFPPAFEVWTWAVKRIKAVA